MLISVQNAGVGGNPAEAYHKIKMAGFEAIDWNIDHAWKQAEITARGTDIDCIFTKSMDEIKEYWKPHLDAIKAEGLTIGQAHAPFPAYLPDFPEFLDFAIEVYKKCILLCAEVGCPNLVVHGISVRAADDRLDHETAEQLNWKLYKSLIPTLKQVDGVTVCLENLFSGSHFRRIAGHCADPNEAVRFIDTLNELAGKECFGLCLDVGHLFLMHVDCRVYVKALGKRIKCLHLHDNNGIDDKHLAPFTGDFPWLRFLGALKDVGYDGNLNFETFAQVIPSRLPAPLVDEFLRHICAIGQYFRSVLQD